MRLISCHSFHECQPGVCGEFVAKRMNPFQSCQEPQQINVHRYTLKTDTSKHDQELLISRYITYSFDHQFYCHGCATTMCKHIKEFKKILDSLQTIYHAKSVN
ncbi:MAG: hypothetical protein Sylvanvirus1_18 [Sylvanvirus sp.]|uniref:Uncharacterized protein n=1 Tax=Sylvanvirus sp. TaxID=2487774 RepID=A0A3G5AGV2_9VIRU|nr:MAG: hypothetical protein Sylvanvirus1_18 [Sylvanvirus sp.]